MFDRLKLINFGIQKNLAFCRLLDVNKPNLYIHIKLRKSQPDIKNVLLIRKKAFIVNEFLSFYYKKDGHKYFLNIAYIILFILLFLNFQNNDLLSSLGDSGI